MVTRITLRRPFGFGLASLLLGACQVIAGIEEREIDPAIASGKQCEDYCTLVMSVCSGKDAVYKNREQCLGICSKLDPGDDQEIESQNTVDCRIREGEIAKLEPADHCKAAGPGGNGVCGTDCEAYCTVYPIACPKDYLYTSKDDCVQACSGLIDQDRYNLSDDHEGDTIECRLVHTSSATVSAKDAAEHCPHATIVPAEPWCTGKPDAKPSCESYCKIELAACTGALKQYEDNEQCLAACTAFDLGTNDDEAGNTIGCRRYHSFSATLAPETHCYHSGPSGDGHCGDHGKAADGHTGNCESYCALSATACDAAFKVKFGDADGCMAACIKLPEAEPDSKYTLASAEKSTGLMCRTLHATRALANPNDVAECLSVFGEGDCK